LKTSFQSPADLDRDVTGVRLAGWTALGHKRSEAGTPHFEGPKE